MKRLLKNFFFGFLAVAMVLSFGHFARAAGEKVIKLGCAISFTGGESRSGKLYRDAYDMAVEQINKNGGVKVGM